MSSDARVRDRDHQIHGEENIVNSVFCKTQFMIGFHKWMAYFISSRDLQPSPNMEPSNTDKKVKILNVEKTAMNKMVISYYAFNLNALFASFNTSGEMVVDKALSISELDRISTQILDGNWRLVQGYNCRTLETRDFFSMLI